MIGPAEYPEKLEEKRLRRGTSLRNSEHLEQEHLFLFYKFSETENSRVRGEKAINKGTRGHNGIQTEGRIMEYPQNPKGKLFSILNPRSDNTIN